VQRNTRTGSPLVLLISAIGAASFLYPFFLPALAGSHRSGVETPLLFTAIGGLCLLMILLEVQGAGSGVDHGASKMVALLGVLVATDATLRLIPTFLGASPIFFLIILAGFSFGPRFGFLMGALTLLVSALITGGLGPWLPYQMLGAGWIGMTAGWIPHHNEPGSRRDIILLAGFGAFWGFLFGAILNLTEWPFAAPGLREQTGLYWVPGMSLGDTISTYWRFYLSTSLVYDSFRAVANLLLVLALARPVLRLFARYHSRFIWEPWQPYAPEPSRLQR
jgi:energy-coupling factor transport system substrate-specific component